MKTKQFIRTLAFATVVLALGLTAQAGTVYPDMDIIVTFTAGADIFGFVNGQAYTVVYTVNGGYEQNPCDDFRDYKVTYQAEEPGDSPVWGALGGTALSGTYAFPAAGDPYDYLSLRDAPGSVDVRASSDDDTPLGLLLPDNTALLSVQLQALLPGLLDNATLTEDEYINPAALLADCTGTWMAADMIKPGTVSFNGAAFTISQVQIAPTAGTDPVPEPATLSLLGLGLAGLAARRRRRRA